MFGVVPLLDVGLTPIALPPCVYDSCRFGVEQDADPFRSLNTLSVALPNMTSQQRSSYEMFQCEPAITRLDWFFAA